MDWIAIGLAAAAAWIAGGIWYGALGKLWLGALGKTRAELPAPTFPMVLSFVADLVLAFALTGILGPEPGIETALGMAALVWLGFVLTTVSVNNAFAGRSIMLTMIDAGHWLVALVAARIVIGLKG